jgi:hypothetical protein
MLIPPIHRLVVGNPRCGFQDCGEAKMAVGFVYWGGDEIVDRSTQVGFTGAP